MTYKYFLVFSSIILGLGVTNIFEGIGNYVKIINKTKRVKIRFLFGHRISKKNENKIIPSFALSIWVITMIVVAFQYFAGSYELYEQGPMKSIGVYVTNILLPTMYFIISKIIIPDFNAPDVEKKLTTSEYSLPDFYYRNKNTLAYLGIGFIVLVAYNFILIEMTKCMSLGCIFDCFKDYFYRRFGAHFIIIALLLCVALISKSDILSKDQFHIYIKSDQLFWLIQSIIAIIVLALILCLARDVINKAIVFN
jgi:hypothetical protein